MKRRISAADIVVFIVLFLSMTAAIVAAYTFLMKEVDYRASEKEYEEIRSEYVNPGKRDESRSRGITETEEEPEELPPHQAGDFVQVTKYHRLDPGAGFRHRVSRPAG